MKKILIGLLALSMSLFSAETALVKTLDNGMTVVVKENKTTNSAIFYCFVKTGSLDEGKDMGKGLSHLVEHLLFRGTTQKKSEKEYEEIAKRTGASINAWTNNTRTAYHFISDPKYRDDGINFIIDHMMYPAFDSIEIAREKEVVAKEIIKHIGNPYEQIEWRMNELNNSSTNWKYPIIGYPELLKTTTRADVIDYYNKRYMPNNMYFIAVGNFNADEIMTKLEKELSIFPRRPLEMSARPEQEPYGIDYRFAEEFDIAQAKGFVNSIAPKAANQEWAALSMAGDILFGKQNTPLKNRLIHELKAVNSLNGWMGSRGMGFDFETTNPAEMDKAIKTIYTEIEKIVSKGFTQKEIDNLLKRYEAQHIMKQPSPMQEAYDIGETLAYHNVINTHENDMEVYRKVKPEDISAAVKKYLLPAHKLIFLAMPKGSLTTISNQKEVIVTKTELTKTDLDGITLLHKENNLKPIVNGTIILPVNFDYEKKETIGTLSFMTTMLFKGSKKYSDIAITDFLEDRAAKLESYLGTEGLYIKYTCHKQDLDEMKDIIADALLNPKFDTKAIEALKQEKLNEYNKNLSSPEAQHAEYRSTILYKNKRESITAKERNEIVQKLTNKDLIKLHTAFIRGEKLIVAFSGDIAKATAEKISSQLRKNVSKKSIEEQPTPLSLASFKPGEYFNAYSFDQVNLDLNFVVPNQNEADFNTAQLITMLFNNGRLHDATRGGSKDLAYWAGFMYRYTANYGFFRIVSQTTANRRDALISSLKNELERLKKGDISQKEIIETIEGVQTRNQAMTNEKEQVDEAAYSEAAGLGYEFQVKKFEPLKSITPKQIQDFANKYLKEPSLFVSYPSEDVKTLVK